MLVHSPLSAAKASRHDQEIIPQLLRHISRRCCYYSYVSIPTNTIPHLSSAVFQSRNLIYAESEKVFERNDRFSQKTSVSIDN